MMWRFLPSLAILTVAASTATGQEVSGNRVRYDLNRVTVFSGIGVLRRMVEAGSMTPDEASRAIICGM